MELEFVKMEGLGNDFILLDDRAAEIGAYKAYPDLARQVCSRRFGIGGDGILLILNSDDHDIKFRIYNCDGSQAEMCGNGMRCFARYLYENRIVNKKVMRVDTLAGTVVPEVITNGSDTVVSVKVDMGVPVLESSKIPVVSDGERTVADRLEVAGRVYEITCVSMGNPHTVIFTDDLSGVALETIGPVIETHERFPEKTNVEFVQVLSDTALKMRVWERGAGITLACGTGACAVHVAAHLTGRVKERTRVCLDGGDLELFWDKKNNHVFKTGPARQVFKGRILL